MFKYRGFHEKGSLSYLCAPGIVSIEWVHTPGTFYMKSAVAVKLWVHFISYAHYSTPWSLQCFLGNLIRLILILKNSNLNLVGLEGFPPPALVVGVRPLLLPQGGAGGGGGGGWWPDWDGRRGGGRRRDGDSRRGGGRRRNGDCRWGGGRFKVRFPLAHNRHP